MALTGVRVTVFWLGPVTNGDLGPTDPLQRICREWIQKLGFDGATACAKVGDDQVGAKNTEPDGLTARGKGLLIRKYEFPPRPTSLRPTPLWEISHIIYPFLWFILFLHLLVIHTHT